MLRQARAAGLRPATVIDIGAARGDFAAACATVFPDARYALVEPLAEFAEVLHRLRARLPGAVLVQAAVTTRPGMAILNVHPDLFGSSLYREVESAPVNGTPREVPVTTLDRMVLDFGLMPPFLIKIDVQGAELDALEGGTTTLEGTEFAILEASLFGFFAGGPQLADVVSYLKAKGLVAYDIVGLSHRPLDGALAQVDVAFVKERGPLRERHHFATPDQRAALTRRLRR